MMVFAYIQASLEKEDITPCRAVPIHCGIHGPLLQSLLAQNTKIMHLRSTRPSDVSLSGEAQTSWRCQANHPSARRRDGGCAAADMHICQRLIDDVPKKNKRLKALRKQKQRKKNRPEALVVAFSYSLPIADYPTYTNEIFILPQGVKPKTCPPMHTQFLPIRLRRRIRPCGQTPCRRAARETCVNGSQQ